MIRFACAAAAAILSAFVAGFLLGAIVEANWYEEDYPWTPRP